MIGWLKRAIKGIPGKAVVPQRGKYFHEDDYCQQEILPIENWHDCAEQIGEIRESAQKSFDGTAGGPCSLEKKVPNDSTSSE